MPPYVRCNHKQTTPGYAPCRRLAGHNGPCAHEVAEPRLPFWRNPDVVGKTPLITTFLLEWANVSQLWQMWTRGTAAGQNLWGWASVNLALILWCNYYRVVAPEANRTAFLATLFGVGTNLLVCLSVLYFRMIGKG